MDSRLPEPSPLVQPGQAASSDSLDRARRGDLVAFRELLRQHKARVYSMALRITGQPADAEELAQDVFLQLHGALPTIASDAHLKHWLLRTVSHRCIDHLRRSERRPQLVSIDALPESAEPAAESTGDPLLASQARRLLLELAPEARAVLLLRFQEDLDPSDIASVLAMSVNTVKSHLRRSLEWMRAQLAETAMQIEQTLRAAFAPCNPAADFEDVVMRRVSAGAWRATHDARRKVRRTVVLGAILAVVAAAGMFASRLIPPSSVSVMPPPVTGTPSIAPVDSPDVGTAPQPGATAVVTEANEVPGPMTPAAPAPHSYTVHFRLLTGQIDDPDMQASIQDGFAHFVDAFRVAPGLVPVAAGQPADYRVTYYAEDERRGRDSWQIVFVVETAQRNPDPGQLANGRGMARALRSMYGVSDASFNSDGYALVWNFNSYDRVEPGCAPSTPAAEVSVSSCPRLRNTPRQVETLRAVALPPDPALEHSMQQRVADQSVPWDDRYGTLRLLASVLQSGERGHGLDQDFLRGALDLIAGTPEAGNRAVMWRTLEGGLDRFGPLPLLIDAVRREPDEQARVDAVKMLGKDFKADAQARAALQVIAREDSSELVRNVARQAVWGDAEWRAYALSTVQDSTLTPAQRLQPLSVMMSSGQFQNVGTVLDQEVVRALTQILPALANDPDRAVQSTVRGLVGRLGNVRTEGVVDLLLAVLRATDDGQPGFTRFTALQALVLHADDPRARPELEKIAGSDADPMMRQAAAAALKAPAAQGPAPN